MMMTVRHERPEDAVAIRRINELAFGQPNEARLEVFMVAELLSGALDGRTGLVKYRPEFAQV